MTRTFARSSRLSSLASVLSGLAGVVALAGASTTARADAPSDRARRGAMPAIAGALEITVGVSAATTHGDLGGAMDGGELIGSAGELELQIGSRITPNLAISFYATAQDGGDGSNARRDVNLGSAGVEADLHLRPASSVDPWFSLGGGVRAVMIREDGTSLLIGAELARVQLGVDLRMSEDVAIVPMIGASASLYGAERTPMDGISELADKDISWTFTAGVAARFDTFGTRR